MKKHIIYLLLISSSFSLQAQQNVSISDAPATPDATSVLDVSSTTKGMLIPRMTTIQRNAIIGPANGLLVYDTDVNCVFYYSTTLATWNSLCSNTGPGVSNLLANTTTVAAGANCANGGIMLQIGNDTNSNGLLDPTEITSTQYICNGQVGSQGVSGTNGINCWDLNGNGTNDPAEDINSDGLFNTSDCIGSGSTWNITSNNFTSAGNLQIITTAPQTVNSTNQAWLVGGNNFGTNGLPYKLGTISNDHVDFISNNTSRGRMLNTGELIWGATAFSGSSIAGDIFTAYKSVGTSNNWAVNGINSTTGGGSGYFENSSINNVFNSVEGVINYSGSANAPSGVFGLAISNNNAQTGVGVRGSTNGRDGYGVWGSRVGTTGTLGFGGVFQNDLGFTGTLFAISDERTKKNVKPMQNALGLIMQLKGVNYEYDIEKYPYLGLASGKQYGFIAQEISKVIPEIVELHNLDINGCKPQENKNGNDTKLEQFNMVDYVSVIPILVEAMKEQQKQIEILKTEVEILKSEINKD